MPEHVDIVNADCHEPKHITDALTSDAGKVITPSGSTAGTSELRKLSRTELSDYVEHYGQQLISANTTTTATTAAVDATLKTNSDYAQITAIWEATPSGENNGVTQGANGALTVTQDGVYRVDMWCNVKSDTASTLAAFKFAVNGTISLVRRPTVFMRNAGELHNSAAHGFVALSASDVVTLHYACDKTVNLTIEDVVFSIQLIRAT